MELSPRTIISNDSTHKNSVLWAFETEARTWKSHYKELMRYINKSKFMMAKLCRHCLVFLDTVKCWIGSKWIVAYFGSVRNVDHSKFERPNSKCDDASRVLIMWTNEQRLKDGRISFINHNMNRAHENVSYIIDEKSNKNRSHSFKIALEKQNSC